MNILLNIFINLAGIASGISDMFFSIFRDGEILSTSGTGAVLALAAIVTIAGSIPEGTLAAIRRWHGSIDDQLENIINLTDILTEHKSSWIVPTQLLDPLTANCNELCVLVPKCRSTSGSTSDRAHRNTLLKSTVGYCLLDVRIWVYQAYKAGALTADNVHDMGFLLPGEHGGKHKRSEPTDVVAEVKATVINEDFIRVVIDQATGKNAGPVIHGWPTGVKTAVIVITAADGVTEIYRQMTDRLHNDIKMPAGSHGKQFIIKAAFLKHVDDEPKFGNEPTFSMPLTTEDLAAEHDRQHHEEFEERMQEIERHRQEIERLQEELKAKNN
jgi:hypothetical protein